MSLSPNTKLGRYEIRSKIGEGGMGEVYLAEDSKLGRKVAIKFLPAEAAADERAKRRLIREAKAAAALDHPNICAIYEVGEEDGPGFIAMQYVQGETLASRIQRNPLGLTESLDIAVQVADALSEAHTHGIIHRDIKPQNIMITPQGQVKVLDFGLAKVVPGADTRESEAQTRSLLTTPGVMVGTVPYMSPEQVRGQVLDVRTDIFSFAVVLYEMLSGRQPFAAESVAEIIAALQTREPPPLLRYARDAPAELHRIISKALRKDREERYQTIKDLLIDLKTLRQELGLRPHKETIGGSGEVGTALERGSRNHLMRAVVGHKLTLAGLALVVLSLAGLGYYLLDGAGKAIDSMAVLPFTNLSADPNAEYLSDGITESLINALSQLPKLTVMSRDSVFHYKGQATTAQAAGRALKVQAVLSGRVTLRGDTLAISAELVQVQNNRQLWGEQYHRKLTDLLAVQEEISREISDKLRLRLSGEEQKRLTKRYTENAEAYQLYLKGRYHAGKISEEGLKRGVEYFQRAIDQDPSYARAYAGLADCYEKLGGVLGFFSPREYYPRANAAAMKALEMDETLAEAHGAVASVRLYYDWNRTEAERELQRALQLNPNLASAHQRYGTALESVERFDEAIAERKRAAELDPLSPSMIADVGYPLYYARRYNQAIEHYRRALELDPNFFWSYLWIGQAEVQKGRYSEAIAEIDRAVTLSGGNTRALATFGHGSAVAGKRDEAREVLAQLRERSRQSYVSPYYIALVYTGLGDKGSVFEWLEKAYEEREPYLIQLKVEPVFDSLRSDPRFRDLMRRVGLAP